MKSPKETNRQPSIDVFLDERTLRGTMADDVRIGLTASSKYLLPKYFYDDTGSELFERITEQPEYYVTRVERELLARISTELMNSLRPQEVVELGSGSSNKTRLLLNTDGAARYVRRYLPFDVSEPALRTSSKELLREYPFLEIHGIIGDFEQHIGQIDLPIGRRLVLFLGSTIGNLEQSKRYEFFSMVRTVLGPGGRFLIGVDLVKDSRVLNAAYNDAEGITACFNRNILHVVNTALRGDFVPTNFKHLAFYDTQARRVEMHLVPTELQKVSLRTLDLEIAIAAGERIWTESSYKFTEVTIGSELAAAGLRLERWYTDERGLFGLALATGA